MANMKKVLVIVGPTGVGKTKVSVKLAKLFQGEIISGDAYQIYKQLNIGSAKVTNVEKQSIPHYLIDELDYHEASNVKFFQEQARFYIDDISKRHKLPIICGGTGLYVKSTLYDYMFEDEKEDSHVLKEMNKKSNEELYQQLQRVDEVTSQSIHQNNRKRVIRALMIASSGETKSEREQKQEHTLMYDTYIVCLTKARENLYEDIDCRVDQMINDGLLQEVNDLYQNNEEVWNLGSMQGIGYKEWKAYFQGNKTQAEVVELIKKNTRNFVKRQYTWFRNQMPVHWVDVETKDWQEQLIADIDSWLHAER